MNGMDCRAAAAEIWAAWPDAGTLEERTRAHAAACASCGAELEAMRAAAGRAVPLGRALPPAYFQRVARATIAALEPRPARSLRPWLLAPAFAAAAVLWVLHGREPATTPRPAPAAPPTIASAPVLPAPPTPAAPPSVEAPPPEVLARLDFFRHMDMVEDLEL